MEPVSHFEQDILRKNHPPIRLTIVYDYALTVEHVADFRATMTGPAVIGVAPAFGVNGAFRAIAFASSTDVLLLRIGTTTDLEAKRTAKLTGLNRLADDILSNPALTKVAFRSEVLASALFLDLYLRVAELLDLFSLAGTQQPPTIVALLSKLVDGNGINMRKARDLFRDDAYNMQDPNRMAMRAWVAQAMAATHCRASLGRLPKLDNRVHHTQSLTTLSILVRQAHQLDALKPQTTKNDVEHDFKMEDGKLLVKNTRYKTRLQASPTQVVHVETVCQGRRTIHEGRVGRVRGHAATIDVKTNIVGQDISITTVGKDPATNAQRARQEIVWRAFHRQISLDCLPFFSKIWSYPKSSVNLPPLPPAPSIDYSRPLNDSQKTAIDAILSDADENRLVMIHGPPGTGKTTVISAAVNSMSKACPDRGIWLLAQSNVAVKNIAEKLASIDFLKFKLLVSEGFHFEWHEHLYDKISDKVILSDEFPTDLVTAENALLDARVILCTLSMMSSSHISPIARVARVQTVIIDEASQIQIGDYIPLLQYFKATLAKLVFIGDDKQLAPYGHEDIRGLQSVFEVPALRTNSVFLDTSYRMPQIIGNFISNRIYDGRLKSVHDSESREVCRIVDVDKGVEERHGNSWVNTEETHIVVRIARKFEEERKSFRIITGYDAQRNSLENAMKIARLPWEDKCFNVDSFQGNEDDYIIVFVVRTKRAGFLSDMRRSNVMLSRCKRGMVICSNRSFLSGPGSSSLIGGLAEDCGDEGWLTRQQVLNGRWKMES